MAETMNRELGWDEEIEYTEGGFFEFPDGEYDFVVDHFERQKVGGDGAYAGQNMAKVFFNIQTPEGEAHLTSNLILNEKFIWKLSQFFVSIGIMKGEKGERLKLDWNSVAGKSGRCKVEKKPNYNDATKFHMEITEFLKPSAKDWSKGF